MYYLKDAVLGPEMIILTQPIKKSKPIIIMIFFVAK